MKLNKFIKKSIASKFFLMNLIILICTIGLQLLFQALYFEKYYINKKESKLEDTIIEFKEFLLKDRTDEEIITFIDKVQRQENIVLCYRNGDLSDGYSSEYYMGQDQIVVKDNITNKEYKIVLGEQFPKVKLNKDDVVEVYGAIYKYGYVYTEIIRVNEREIQPYYDIVPKIDFNMQNAPASQMMPSLKIDNEIYIKGKVENFIAEDKSYILLSNADLYLSVEEKKNIVLNNKYVAKTSLENNVDEMLLSSEKFSGGYLIAMTPLSEVNDVLGNMNSYYFIIFLFAFLIVIIISLVYSKYMTKPLVEMSNIAKKISECNFQYKYNVKSEDEIGVLGESLNLISSNLEKSLSGIQDANEKLKNEMEVKKVQEEKRKELIANISHELKTPITIIQGSINGIKSGMYTTDMYDDILEETNKMNELVKEMLEISKLESPNFNLKKEAFDLGSIFLKEKDKLRGLIKEKSLEMNYNNFEDIIVFGDEKRINQVVTNLLTNAIKYTPDNGKINIFIDLDKEREEYVFSIENFGISLTKDELDKIWDPFYRKEKSRNKKYGGTGLGLSIVKRILEVHNSEFGVDSTGNSVRFYFSIAKSMYY